MEFSDIIIEHIRFQKRNFLFDPTNQAGVIKNLEFLYWACLASEGLLKEAGDEAERLPGEFHQRIACYYRSHFDEEKGEIGVLKKDLASEGVKPDLPDEFSMGMVGTQYYLLKQMDPVCLLGYMAVQEADPTDIKVVEALEQLYGKKLFRFLRMHAIKDLEHRKELIELIDEAPREFHRAIWFSADNTLSYLKKATTEFYRRN